MYLIYGSEQIPCMHDTKPESQWEVIRPSMRVNMVLKYVSVTATFLRHILH